MRGAVLVAGDAANEADLRRAFEGAWGVFAMTFVLAVTGDLDAATEEEFALGALSPRVKALLLLQPACAARQSSSGYSQCVEHPFTPR